MKRSIFFSLILFLIPLFSLAGKKDGFIHKGYLGWLIDLSRNARAGVQWPSVILDDQLIEDYKETIDFLHRSGMNEITSWGFFTNSVWEPQIERTIDEKRKEKIEEMISYAHSKGIKILCGLGVYSWGFNKIIKENPEIKCSCNEEVLDPSNPDSWLWQKKVLDYLTNFEFDGFSLQSADRGRCKCGEYGNLSNLEYHAVLNRKVIDYLRSKRKHYIIGISGWGMNFSNEKDLNSIVKMTRKVDYLIDVEETALKGGKSYRKKLIQSIKPCYYGSTATPNIEPIQALPRDRYFVPIINRTCQRIKELYADGGRAGETYVRTRGNIGDEVSIEVIAKIINDPKKSIKASLLQTLDSIFQPSDKKTLNELEIIYHQAEDAYFNFATGDMEVIQLMPRNLTSPVSQYLNKMASSSRKEYKEVMKGLYEKLCSLEDNIKNKEKYRSLKQCLFNVIEEIEKIES